VIKSAAGVLEVSDVQKNAGWFIHYGRVKGMIKVGEKVALKVEAASRMDTARNHTATHLLHKALRIVVGEHAQQKGSLVEPGRLRFDFSHLAAVEAEQLQEIERIVNESIWQLLPVNTTVASLDDARKMGAIALFGEKYGDKVRVVKVGDYSMEFCGGTHVSNTGQIGLFKVLSEGSVGSGLRRIEAVTGRYAVDYLNAAEAELRKCAAIMHTSPEEVSSRIEVLNRTVKDKDKEIEKLQVSLSKAGSKNLLEQAYTYKGARVLVQTVPAQDANSLREQAEMMRDKLGNASAVVLGSVSGDKVVLVCFVSQELVERGLNAGKIVGAAARAAGGGGGGRPDMAQAGGKDVTKISESLAAAREVIENSLV
jgi:alanyl-tRNA synthetase